MPWSPSALGARCILVASSGPECWCPRRRRWPAAWLGSGQDPVARTRWPRDSLRRPGGGRVAPVAGWPLWPGGPLLGSSVSHHSHLAHSRPFCHCVALPFCHSAIPFHSVAMPCLPSDHVAAAAARPAAPRHHQLVHEVHDCPGRLLGVQLREYVALGEEMK